MPGAVSEAADTAAAATTTGNTNCEENNQQMVNEDASPCTSTIPMVTPTDHIGMSYKSPRECTVSHVNPCPASTPIFINKKNNPATTVHVSAGSRKILELSSDDDSSSDYEDDDHSTLHTAYASVKSREQEKKPPAESENNTRVNSTYTHQKVSTDDISTAYDPSFYNSYSKSVFSPHTLCTKAYYSDMG